MGRTRSRVTQLEFPWRDEESLRTELEADTGVPVRLAITNNRSSMMSVRRGPGGRVLRVRLHRMFLSASPDVICALAAWLKSPRSKPAGEAVNRFIRQNAHQIALETPSETELITQGKVFDLAALFHEVNTRHFGNRVRALITWGRMPPNRRRRTIRFGSYYPEDNVIRIHPLLDQSFVPAYFIRYIVYHEMLHAFLGVKEGKTGRRLYHTTEFLRQEQTFPDYDRAVAWQKSQANLRKLLDRRTGERTTRLSAAALRAAALRAAALRNRNRRP